MHKFILIFSIFLPACQPSAPGDAVMQGSLAPVKPYEELKAEIIATRGKIKEQYLSADSTGKDSLIGYSSQFLRNITQEIFTYWYGTDWDFNGTTQTPKQGKIACGFFVTTVLRDAGFDLPRIAWAQLPSESMIKKVNPSLKR